MWADLGVHLILDNYGAHKTAKVKQWLLRHPRFHCHFTPTCSSWINLAERFFADNPGNNRDMVVTGAEGLTAEGGGPARCRRGAGETRMRMSGYAMLAFLALILAPAAGAAAELRIAAWNLEHLDDADGAGCVGRTGADYAALAGRIEELNADIVAFQEVENEAAAHRVFPASEWHVEMSRRPAMKRSRACWGKPQSRLGHLATGFAIRRGIVYRRHADLRGLGAGDVFQRWATDLSVMSGGRELRLLSVHLKSGCWGAKQDGDTKRKKTCATLRGQIERLGTWADARRAEGTAFVILGDFNRRLTLPGDWAWRLLSPPAAPLLLLTEGVPFRCDPRFPAFIDHMAAGGGAETMRATGSFREAPRRGPHPDHCAISAVFRLRDQRADAVLR